MIEGHIFIQGIISPWQDKGAEEWGEVNIKQVTQQIQDNADAEKLIVHIHSPGGDVDEGFGIYDILVAYGEEKGVEIETRIEGLCASIATVIALAGSVRKMTENSEFMIHNPWGDAWGDADDLQKAADQMKAVEDKVINFYALKTGKSADDLDQWMKEEKWMPSAEALALGFITEIITTMKAVAKFKLKNTVMNTQELDKKIDNRFTELLKKLGLAKGSRAKALTITAADGTVFDFGDQVESIEEIEVGMTATIEGGTPDGEYVMPDGKTFVFTAGTLTEIKEAEEEETEEMKQLKAENEDLKKQLSDLQGANEKAITDLETEVVAMKAQVKSDISTFGKASVSQSGNGEEVSRSPGKPIIGI